FSSSDSGSESEPPPAKKTRVVPLAGGCDTLFQETVPQSAQVQRQGDEPGPQCPAINPANQLTGRRETKKQAFSSQDERAPWKEEETGKDGTVWTVVGEEESRGEPSQPERLDRAADPRCPGRVPLRGGCRNAYPHSRLECG
ncbi:hypothetical protein AMECASPLE_039346, partial [Ameca splendens]